MVIRGGGRGRRVIVDLAQRGYCAPMHSDARARRKDGTAYRQVLTNRNVQASFETQTGPAPVLMGAQLHSAIRSEVACLQATQDRDRQPTSRAASTRARMAATRSSRRARESSEAAALENSILSA
jgi:hypothetical protein